MLCTSCILTHTARRFVTYDCDSKQELSDPRGRHRVPVIVLSLGGLVVATVLTLFQVGVLHSVWEPLFGTGSRRVLTSPVSEALPVPDASLGPPGASTRAARSIATAGVILAGSFGLLGLVPLITFHAMLLLS